MSLYIIRDAEGKVIYQGDDWDAAQRAGDIPARRPNPVAASEHRYTTSIGRPNEPEPCEISGAALDHVRRVLYATRINNERGKDK